MHVVCCVSTCLLQINSNRSSAVHDFEFRNLCFHLHLSFHFPFANSSFHSLHLSSYRQQSINKLRFHFHERRANRRNIMLQESHLSSQCSMTWLLFAIFHLQVPQSWLTRISRWQSRHEWLLLDESFFDESREDYSSNILFTFPSCVCPVFLSSTKNTHTLNGLWGRMKETYSILHDSQDDDQPTTTVIVVFMPPIKSQWKTFIKWMLSCFSIILTTKIILQNKKKNIKRSFAKKRLRINWTKDGYERIWYALKSIQKT